jgi:hypothetical protein
MSPDEDILDSACSVNRRRVQRHTFRPLAAAVTLEQNLALSGAQENSGAACQEAGARRCFTFKDMQGKLVSAGPQFINNDKKQPLSFRRQLFSRHGNPKNSGKELR